ncbi:MAG TPA: ribonuclease P protein component [Patescibacteria group bacterium]|nr:ribonuclease P protein component [Patescibacteria group bacterium]
MKASKSIRTNKEFDLVYKKGKVFFGTFFALRVLVVKDAKDFRVGIVVSNKILPKAVERNKKKRQLREIIRLNQGRLISGVWISLVLKKGSEDSNYQELEKEFLLLAKKAGIIR